MRRFLWSIFVSLSLAPLSTSQMQMSTASGYQAIGELPGPPKNPTISAVTQLWKGALLEQMAELSGPLAQTLQEDVIPDGAAPYPTTRTTTVKLDRDGHETERSDQSPGGTSTTTSVFEGGKLQSRTTMHHRTNSRFSTLQKWQEWQKWKYDTNGRLSDFRAGQDKEEFNHYLNFKYDVHGRPLGFEYRPSGADGPSTFTEISYSGNTVTTIRRDNNRRKVFEQIQVVDRVNRVTELSISDGGNNVLKLWYHSKFKYDEQGRLIEQVTDQYNYAPGDENSEPPPGKVTIQYDDQKHAGEQDFYDVDGKLLVRAVAEFDSHGYVTKQQTLDVNGKQVKGTEGIWVDPKTHAQHIGAYAIEVTYDVNGNWTALQSWFTPSDGGDRILTRSIKQTITYR
jgi:hypothetical protein